MKIAIKTLSVLAIIFVSSSLHAACRQSSAGTQTTTINIGPVTVQRDTPTGTVIAQKSIGSDVANAVYCDAGSYNLMYGLTYNGGNAVGNNVYSTNIPGVGIRLYQATSPARYFSNPAAIGVSYNFAIGNNLTSPGFTVELVKTGNIISDTLAAGAVGSYYIATTTGVGLATMTNINMGAGNSVTQVACSITTQNIQVPLDDVLASDLTATGTVAKPKTFNMGLNCDAGARINMTMSGTKNTDTSTAGVLQLTNAGSSDVATGVGIQILYNNAPVTVNGTSQLVLKTSAGGVESFPFTAQYYQTKSTVTTGLADATATLNLTYQ